jgi:gamma-glutamylcyclotransferase
VDTFKYFAYGSNMLTERLRSRCASAKMVRRAVVANYVLEFCKRSADGSGKVTIVESSKDGALVHGVMFDIAVAERDELDKAEGLGQGYHRVDELTVRLESSDEVRVSTYIGNRLDRSLKPYDWYRALVIAGAKQHQQPADWLAAIERVVAVTDPDLKRDSRLKAIAVLEKSSYGFLLKQ